jgi:hypothetical protein
MATSLCGPDLLNIFNQYRDTGGPTGVFSSPQDWRDQCNSPAALWLLRRPTEALGSSR